MPHTRHLLLDCRAALRRTDPAFEDTPLGERLDAAILAIGQADDARRVEAQAAPGKPMAGRVAYAWQSVARELRHSHPDVYQRMSEQVLKRLDLDALDDPAEEIEALLKSLDTTEQARTRLEAEAAGLRDALAEAVARPPEPAADENAGTGTPAPAAANGAPGPALLHAVANGLRSFAPDELEWCISEALVLTGFQKTPVQLLEAGEAGLARLLLEATAAA